MVRGVGTPRLTTTKAPIISMSGEPYSLAMAPNMATTTTSVTAICHATCSAGAAVPVGSPAETLAMAGMLAVSVIDVVAVLVLAELGDEGVVLRLLDVLGSTPTGATVSTRAIRC